MAHPALRSFATPPRQEMHSVPRKPPQSLWDMPPQPHLAPGPSGVHSAPNTGPRLRPQQTQQQHVVGRKKSTKELVAQYEARDSAPPMPMPVPASNVGASGSRYPSERAPQTTPRRRATLTKRMPTDGLGVPYSSMPRVSSNLTPPPQQPYGRPRANTAGAAGLTPPKPPGEYSPPRKEKDKSPLRESLRNLFGLFKKGKSPGGKGKDEGGEGYGYQREKEVWKEGGERTTWHGDTSESVARRLNVGGAESGRATPEKALPPVTPEQRKMGPAALRAGLVYYLTADRQWTKRHVSLEPPFLYMTDPVLATPSLAMRLERLTSVHSLPRSSALTLPPIRQKEFPDEPYVFELEFEGEGRVELFALETASARSSWVSVFWDAVLSMQPGPSLPAPAQQTDDPFLSPSLANPDPMGNHAPLRVMNGPIPASPSSNSLPSPMPLPRADSGDSETVAGLAAVIQGSGGQSKLRQSSLPHDALGMTSPNSIGLVVDEPALSDLPSRPSSRPLPTVPQDRAPSPLKLEPKTEATPFDEKGAEIIRFPSAFSRRSRTTPGSPHSPPLFSPQTEVDTAATTPPSSPSFRTLSSPTIAPDRTDPHAIRLSSLRSPSPPLSISRRTSYATTMNNSPRSPSIQTLSQMSVVRMRLAKLEVGEARLLPTSPKHSQGTKGDAPTPKGTPTIPTERATPTIPSPTKATSTMPSPTQASTPTLPKATTTMPTLTPNRRLSTNLTSSFHTPPLTVRKRTTLLSRFPMPPAIGEVSSAGEESSTESDFGRPLSVGAKRASTIQSSSRLTDAQDSHRDSSASGQTHFTMARSSQQPEGYAVDWPDSSTESGSTSGGPDDKHHRSSMSTDRSSTVPTPIEQPMPVDLDPVIAMLEPLPGHYSNLSEKVDDVRTGLGNVAGDVHKALQGIAELRTDIAIVVPQNGPQPAVDEEAWQHVRRQLSELVLLVSESVNKKGIEPTENAQDAELVQTMRNLGKKDKEGKDEGGAPEDGKDEENVNNKGGPTEEELATLFEPLLEQQKHLHLQQTDTIRYLNELNPWLQKLAMTAEKGDEIPSDVQRIAKALGIEKPKPQEGEEQPKEGPSFVAQIMEKLDGIRTIVEANQQSREAMDAVLQTLVEQRQEQEKLLRSVAADLSNDIRGERLRFVDAMKEATSLNVQVHLEEFKKQLNQEVFRMTQDVGHLRDEKMKLEQAIAELFAIKAKHGEHLYQLQQAAVQAQQVNSQQAPRQAAKPMPPPPVQQYLNPQQIPGMMYNLPGPYPTGPPQQHPQQPQQQRHSVPPATGRPLQMPAPLAAPQPARQGTRASRPLPAAGARNSATAGPRTAR